MIFIKAVEAAAERPNIVIADGPAWGALGEVTGDCAMSSEIQGKQS
jgi:hypothetical protein